MRVFTVDGDRDAIQHARDDEGQVTVSRCLDRLRGVLDAVYRVFISGESKDGIHRGMLGRQ